MAVYYAVALDIYGGRIGGNIAGGDGGALNLENAWDECAIILYMSDVLVDQNEADFGGAIYSYYDLWNYWACGLIENSRFEDNQATGDGGSHRLRSR